jgi:ElaB/YqjD/DUF883 family membrane-anchored ribosome-binding protein
VKKEKIEMENTSTELHNGTANILESAKRNITETSGKVQQGLQQGYERSREVVLKAGTQVEEAVRRNPLVAVCAAIGIGWIAGRLLLRTGERSYRSYRSGEEEFV